MEVLPVADAEDRHVDCYECPVYYTSERGSTFVFPLHLKQSTASDAETTESATVTSELNKWTFKGVAVLLNNS